MEDKILDVAGQLFVAHGFSGTTLSAIARAAGCQQALVHYYFRTKENLFDRIFEQKIELFLTAILNVDGLDLTLDERIRRMMGMHFDFLREHAALAPFLLGEINTNTARMRSMIEKFRQYPLSIWADLDEVLRSESAKGNIRQVSAVDLTFTMISLSITPFLVLPVVREATGMSDEEAQAMLDERRAEAIETVLARLRKVGSEATIKHPENQHQRLKKGWLRR